MRKLFVSMKDTLTLRFCAIQLAVANRRAENYVDTAIFS